MLLVSKQECYDVDGVFYHRDETPENGVRWFTYDHVARIKTYIVDFEKETLENNRRTIYKNIM